jgi:hypothetical protein
VHDDFVLTVKSGVKSIAVAQALVADALHQEIWIPALDLSDFGVSTIRLRTW